MRGGGKDFLRDARGHRSFLKIRAGSLLLPFPRGRRRKKRNVIPSAGPVPPGSDLCLRVFLRFCKRRDGCFFSLPYCPAEMPGGPLDRKDMRFPSLPGERSRLARKAARRPFWTIFRQIFSPGFGVIDMRTGLHKVYSADRARSLIQGGICASVGIRAQG